MEQQDLSELDKIPKVMRENPTFDARKYQGIKVKIAKVNHLKDEINYYNGPMVNGKPSYNPNSTEKVEKIEIETEPIPKLDDNGNTTDEKLSLGKDEQGNERYVTAKTRFNLSKDENGVWGISHHERASLWKFMRKMGVERLSELIGKQVVLDSEPDRDDISKHWLRINR